MIRKYVSLVLLFVLISIAALSLTRASKQIQGTVAEQTAATTTTIIYAQPTGFPTPTPSPTPTPTPTSTTTALPTTSTTSTLTPTTTTSTITATTSTTSSILTSTTSIHTSTTTTILRCPCLLEEILGDNPEEVEQLRNFRDEVLNKTPSGRRLIRLYYQCGPAILKILEEDDTFRDRVIRLYFHLGPTVAKIMVENEILREELIRLYCQWGPAVIKALEEDESFREEIKDIIDDIGILFKAKSE